MTLSEAAAYLALALWLLEGARRLRQHIAYRRGVQAIPQRQRAVYVPPDDGTSEDQFGGMGSRDYYFGDGAEYAAEHPGAFHGHRQMGVGPEAERWPRLGDMDNETA